MKNLFPKISGFILTLAIILAASGLLLPTSHVEAAGCMKVSPPPARPTAFSKSECDSRTAKGEPYVWDTAAEAAPAPEGIAPAAEYDNNDSFWVRNLVRPAIVTIVGVILQFVSLLTALSGLVLNGVVFHTIVNVSDNYENISAIDTSWKTVRDIANIGFIFVLLYAAIKTILGVGDDTKKLIVNIVVVAILVNFSLFFTKVVIDASNVLALTFYDAIVPGAASQGLTDVNISTRGITSGLSDAFMRHLNLQTLYQATNEQNLTVGAIITTGLMGSIMLLIATFVFFAVAIMLLIRYVVLILVLILSPIAFVAFALPGLEGKTKEWWNALSGQAFFAPIYFMLTWITLEILGGIMGSGVFGTGGPLSGVATVGVAGGSLNEGGVGFVPTFINFAVVIVFLIVSLMQAKEWSNKTGHGIGKITSFATGAAGGLSLGMAGRLGRNTVGRAGAMIGDSRYLKDKIEQGGAAGWAARRTLDAGRSTAGRSFDLRGTGIGGSLDAGKAQKGGYADTLKKKREEEKKFADSLGPTEEEKQKAKAAREKIKAGDAPDPRFTGEYLREKVRQEKEAKRLDEEAAKKRTAAGSMSGQKKFDTEAEASRMEQRSKTMRNNVKDQLSYADSIAGTDKAITDERKADVNRMGKKAIDEFNETSPEAKAEKDAIEKAAAIKEDLAKKRKELEEAIDKVSEDRINAEIEDIQKDLEAAEEEVKTTSETAKEGREKIKATYATMAEAIKDIKGIGDRRKESYAQAKETGWVTGKAAKAIESLAPDIKEGEAPGLYSRAVYKVAEAVAHKNRAAAAEIRKGSKPIKDQLEQILKDAGELPKKDDDAGTPAPDAGGAPKT